MGSQVVIDGVAVVIPIAGGGDEQDPRVPAAADRPQQRCAVSAAAPRVVSGHHVHAVPALEIGDVVHGPHRVAGPATAGAQELGRDHRDVPVHADHAGAIARSTNGAGHVGAVVVVRPVVHGGIVVVEVPAVDVVHVAVAVVVDAVGGNLPRVDPDVVGKIGVGDLHPGVDDAHVHGRRPREPIGPGGGGIAAPLIRWARRRAVHAPESAGREVRVVRGGGRAQEVVLLHAHHIGVALQIGHGLIRRGARGQSHQLEARRAWREPLRTHSAHVPSGRPSGGAVGRRCVLHDHAVGRVFRGRRGGGA